MIIKSEELQAEFTLPDRFTGADYAAYMEAMNGNAISAISQGIDGALAIITSAHYVEDGKQRDLLEEGVEAPLPVLVWIQAEVAHYVRTKMQLPKLSFEPLAPPPKTKAKRRQNST